MELHIVAALGAIVLVPAIAIGLIVAGIFLKSSHEGPPKRIIVERGYRTRPKSVDTSLTLTTLAEKKKGN